MLIQHPVIVSSNHRIIVIFTSLENLNAVYIPVLPPALRTHIRDFGVCAFHAIPMEMGR